MIPVTIHLDARTFDSLERIAADRGISMRELITTHLAQGLEPTMSRTITTKGKPLRSQDIQDWIRAAQMGVTNRSIAERWGVTENMVSRYLIDAGVRRQKVHSDLGTPRKTRDEEEAA